MINLHGQIMNLPHPPMARVEQNPSIAYKMGHRDARHAAAELALKADACIEALRELEAMAERYRAPGASVPDAQKRARNALAAFDEAAGARTTAGWAAT